MIHNRRVSNSCGARSRDAEENGSGAITEINFQATFKEKIDKDTRKSSAVRNSNTFCCYNNVTQSSPISTLCQDKVELC